MKINLIHFTKWLFARLPHIKCMRLGYVRSSHLPYDIHPVGLRAFKYPYICNGLESRSAFQMGRRVNSHFQDFKRG